MATSLQPFLCQQQFSVVPTCNRHRLWDPLLLVFGYSICSMLLPKHLFGGYNAYHTTTLHNAGEVWPCETGFSTKSRLVKRMSCQKGRSPQTGLLSCCVCRSQHSCSSCHAKEGPCSYPTLRSPI